jgi:hypothetical protein
MKRKMKKLSLSRETLRSLNPGSLKVPVGGLSLQTCFEDTCDTCYTNCGTCDASACNAATCNQGPGYCSNYGC